MNSLFLRLIETDEIQISCWRKPSLIDLHHFLSLALLIRGIRSDHLAFGQPWILSHCLGVHCYLIVHMLSLRQEMSPPHLHFPFLMVLIRYFIPVSRKCPKQKRSKWNWISLLKSALINFIYEWKVKMFSSSSISHKASFQSGTQWPLFFYCFLFLQQVSQSVLYTSFLLKFILINMI